MSFLFVQRSRVEADVCRGALAVAIGAASLVQPELVAGEVALIGKMAADSAKKTVTTIASDTGSKVVKAISKDIADDAKEEAAKDVAAKAAKDKVDGGEKGEAATPEASDSKAAPTESVKEVPNASTSSPSDPKTTPTSNSTSKDKTIAIEVAQEPSKVTSSGGASSSDSKTDPPATAPVSLKITLGADGEVKAVTKGDVEQKEKLVDSAPESAISNTSSVQTSTKTAIVSTELTKEKTGMTPEIPTSVPQSAPVSEKGPETTQDTLQTTDDIPAVSSPAIVSAVATVTSVSKTSTISKTTTEDPATTTKTQMVTVSQESLDLLHQSTYFSSNHLTSSYIDIELDAMLEAIQQITKILAFNMPTPTPEAPGSNPIESMESMINEALATAVKPLADLVPEMIHQNDNTTHPPLEDPSAPNSLSDRPTPEKRRSVLGSIGKVFWPFGVSEKVATVTVTEVTADQPEVAE